MSHPATRTPSGLHRHAARLSSGAWLLLATGCLAQASGDRRPSAPEGYRWQRIESLSDEFDSTALDREKWIPHHPFWGGRDSRHEPSNVSVAGGHLRLRSSLRDGA